jgi:histidine triad (HIT) family protein
MEPCIFCKIAAGEIPCERVYEDAHTLAFRDIHPQAPVHVLVIPKAHAAESAADVNEANAAEIAHCFVTIAKVIKQLGLSDGARVVSNCGAHAGQTVRHLHFHVLGGRNLELTMG